GTAWSRSSARPSPRRLLRAVPRNRRGPPSAAGWSRRSNAARPSSCAAVSPTIVEVLDGEGAEDHGGAQGGAGAGVEGAERVGGGVAGGVETGDDRAVLA